MDSIHLAHDGNPWRTIINTVMNFNISERASFFEPSVWLLSQLFSWE